MPLMQQSLQMPIVTVTISLSTLLMSMNTKGESNEQARKLSEIREIELRFENERKQECIGHRRSTRCV